MGAAADDVALSIGASGRLPRLAGRGRIERPERSLRRVRDGGVFLDPLPTELHRFFGGQPGPVGATGAECDPDGLTVDMLFDREGCRVGH